MHTSLKVLVFSSNPQRSPARSAAVLLLTTGLLAAGAGAQESATIAVDCPTLDAESRAAVEARARADLMVRNAFGTLVVACRQGEGRLTWHPLTGVPVATAVPLDADPRSSVERILEGLGALVPAGAAPGNQASSPGAAPEAPVAAPPAPSAPPPAPPPPVVQPANIATEPKETWRGGFRGVLLGAGMGGELWSGTAALGPQATVLLSLPARFEAGAAATLFFTLRAPDQVSGRITRIALRGAYALDPGERFRVGADAFVDLVHAAAPNAGSANDATFGALLRATAALVVTPIRLELGPTLAIHPTPVRAQIGPGPDGSNGAVAFRLPALTAGLVLDVFAGPL